MNQDKRAEILRRVTGASADVQGSHLAWFSTDTPFIVEVYGGLAFLQDMGGSIQSHVEYLRLRDALDAFYARATPEEISAYNAADKTRRAENQNKKSPGHVYIMRFGDRYKIGMTTVGVENRRQQTEQELRRHVNSGAAVEVVRAWETQSPHDLEARMHFEFRDHRLEGEWFSLSEDNLARVIAFAEANR